ncbi:hypothetical protein PCANB_001376 [Pneumocystis canis]|nr:hypothetical protein PCANB_001376 [Pneumocystis canis]
MHTFTADLNLLYEIVVVADASKQKGSFLAIFEAYDTVLRRKNIDSVNDRIYYKFLLKLVQIQGQGWKYKFKSLMKDMGIDFKSIAKTNIQNSVPVDRYGELNYLFTPDNEELSKSSKEFFYNSYETFDNSLNFQTRNSPAAIEFTQREQIRSPLYNDIEKNVKQAEYIYNERCIQIKQKYFRTWIQKTKYVYNGFQSMYFKAVMHDTYILSFQALGIWRQKSLYYEKIKNNAHNARNYIQMEKSFIKWIKAFYIKKKECRDLYNFILMRIFLNSWRKIWIMQYKVAALYRLSFSFSIWKKKLLIQKNSAFEATKWQRLHILKHIFVNWRTKTYLNRLKFNKELKKKHKVFLLWKWQLELIYRKKKSLIKSYSKKLINYYYKLWHQKLKQNQENMTKAITLSNNLNIIKTFQLWNIKYKTEVSKKLFLSFKNIFLCKKHFLNWKKKTENKQMASDFFNYLLLRSTFLYWRRKLHFNAFLIKLKNELKGKIIYKWILKERLTLLLRIKGRRLCYLIFYFWRKRYHTLNNKDLPLIFMLKNKINHRIKTITFLKWTEKLFLLRKNEKNAKTIIHINTKRNIINIWRKKNIIIQKNNTTAGYKNNYLYMKHTIVHWKKIFYKKTEAQKELQLLCTGDTVLKVSY